MSYCRHYEDDIWAAAETGQPSEELVRHAEKCVDCARAMQTAVSATAGFHIFRNVRAPDTTVAVKVNTHAIPRRWGRLALAGAATLVGLAMFTYLSTRMPDMVGAGKTSNEHPRAVSETRETARSHTAEQELEPVDTGSDHALMAISGAKAEPKAGPPSDNATATHKRKAPPSQPNVVVADASPQERLEVVSDKNIPVIPEQTDYSPAAFPAEHYVIGLVGVDIGDPDRVSYPIAQYIPNVSESVDL